MTPAILDITINKGITFGLVLKLKDAALSPVSLVGYSVFADARLKPTSTAIAFSLSPTISDAPQGEVTISLTDEATALLKHGIFHWDLVIENPSGERLGPFVEGAVFVKALATQP